MITICRQSFFDTPYFIYIFLVSKVSAEKKIKWVYPKEIFAPLLGSKVLNRDPWF